MSDNVLKLPQAAHERLHEFVALANRQQLHPLDWERFYDFIYVFSLTDRDATHQDVADLLRAAGFADHVVDRLAALFDHGVTLLRRYRTDDQTVARGVVQQALQRSGGKRWRVSIARSAVLSQRLDKLQHMGILTVRPRSVRATGRFIV